MDDLYGLIALIGFAARKPVGCLVMLAAVAAAIAAAFVWNSVPLAALAMAVILASGIALAVAFQAAADRFVDSFRLPPPADEAGPGQRVEPD